MGQGKVVVDFFKMLASYEKQNQNITQDDVNTIILNVGVIEEYENLSEAFQMGYALLLEEEYARYNERVEVLRLQRLAGLEKARAVKNGNKAAQVVEKVVEVQETALEAAIRAQRELKQTLLDKRNNKQQGNNKQQQAAQQSKVDRDYIVIDGIEYKKVN